MNATTLAVAIAGVLAIVPPASCAQPHRAEIEREVVDRCYRWTVAYRLHAAGVDGRHMKRMVRELKEAEHTERLITSITEIVADMSPNKREAIYDIAAVECFVSGSDG